MPWTRIGSSRWRRHDGAEVWRGDDYYSNPERPGNRMWEGAGPGNGNHLLKQPRRDRRERFTVRRRFGTPETAMAAVDRMFPAKPE